MKPQYHHAQFIGATAALRRLRPGQATFFPVPEGCDKKQATRNLTSLARQLRSLEKTPGLRFSKYSMAYCDSTHEVCAYRVF